MCPGNLNISVSMVPHARKGATAYRHHDSKVPTGYLFLPLAGVTAYLHHEPKVRAVWAMQLAEGLDPAVRSNCHTPRIPGTSP